MNGRPSWARNNGVELPPISYQLGQRPEPRNHIDHSEVNIPRCVKIRGRISLVWPVGVLEVGKEASATIGRAGIERSRPDKIQLSTQAMKIPDLESRLQAVVVGEGVVVKLQDVVVLRELAGKRLPAGIASVRSADRAGIQIAPVEQVPPGRSHKGKAERVLLVSCCSTVRLYAWFIGVWKSPYDLDHVEGRGRCDALPINVHARRQANEIRTKRVTR